MKKIAEETTRFNCKLPKVLADWVGYRAKGHGINLSEEVRHILMECKTGEEMIAKLGTARK